jgi:protein TonB
MRGLLVIVGLLACYGATAQHTKVVHSQKSARAPHVMAVEAPPVIYAVVEERASFPMGQDALDKYLADHLRYPAAAAEAGIQGRVFVQFVIDEQGKVGQARVVRGVSRDCDEEALRVVRAMPAWRPAKYNGKAQSSVYLLPVVFKRM